MAAATFSDISRWFDQGVTDGERFMLIICDTYDYTDAPDYTKTADEAREMRKSPGSMQKVMEIYDLTKHKDTQMSQPRCWAL